MKLIFNKLRFSLLFLNFTMLLLIASSTIARSSTNYPLSYGNLNDKKKLLEFKGYCNNSYKSKFLKHYSKKKYKEIYNSFKDRKEYKKLSWKEKYENYHPADIVKKNMVKIPGGKLKLEDGRILKVESFQISKFQVTQWLWFLVMGNNPSKFRKKKHFSEEEYLGVSMGNREVVKMCKYNPVEYITRDEVEEFIKRLNELSGLKFRLPTGAEWEFAARGGERTKKYYHGNEFDKNEVNIYAWNYNNSGDINEKNRRTHPVGLKPANKFGLHDIFGNVWELTREIYSDSSLEAQYLIKMEDTNNSTVFYSVLRGGSWFDGYWSSWCFQCSYRFYYHCADRRADVGLRLARAI